MRRANLSLRVALAVLASAFGLLGATQASAAGCAVTASLATTLGTYSPAAVNAGAVPALSSAAGLTCPTAVITLLSNNSLRATVTSTNVFLLKQQGGTASVSYVASADPNGTYKYTQGGMQDYMQNNLLNALGLLGGSSATMPIYIRPVSGTTLPVGSYTDRLTINWSWYQCPGIGALGACIGSLDSGSGRTTLDVTLVVSARNMTLTVTSPAATWDPVNLTVNPKALPGGRVRMVVAASNPDIVPLDAGTLALVIPMAGQGGQLALGLDGDGSSSTVFQFTDGSTASGMTLTYTSPGDTSDDVDFSSDGGNSWSYVPVAGDAVSEGAVTHIRLRPRGAMAKQSSFSISFPYVVR